LILRVLCLNNSRNLTLASGAVGLGHFVYTYIWYIFVYKDIYIRNILYIYTFSYLEIKFIFRRLCIRDIWIYIHIYIYIYIYVYHISPIHNIYDMYISTNSTEWEKILSERHFSERIALNLEKGKRWDLYIESLGSWVIYWSVVLFNNCSFDESLWIFFYSSVWSGETAEECGNATENVLCDQIIYNMYIIITCRAKLKIEFTNE